MIDAHQHFWQYDAVKYDWIDDSMAAIRQSFMPSDLKNLLEQNQVDGTVLVQVNQSMDENNFMLSLAKENDFIRGVVGWVDLQSENITEELTILKQHNKLKGFRHILQAEKDADFMLRPNFKRGIAALAAFNYTFDVLIYPHQLAAARVMVNSYPNQLFVIDHLAKPYIKNRFIDNWKYDLQDIAAHENVHCKISGMFTEANWTDCSLSDLKPYLDVAVEAFGIKRLLFGSDWPVCLLATDYKNNLSVMQEYFKTFSSTEQQQFFAQNAINFYNLND